MRSVSNGRNRVKFTQSVRQKQWGPTGWGIRSAPYLGKRVDPGGHEEEEEEEEEFIRIQWIL